MKFIAPAKSINNKHKHEYKQSTNELKNSDEKYPPSHIIQHSNKPIDLDSGDINTQYNTLQEIKLKSGLSQGKLTLRAIPYFFWLIGVFFILAGFLLLINLLLGIGSNSEQTNQLITNSSIIESSMEVSNNISDVALTNRTDVTANNTNNTKRKYIFNSFNEGKWWQYLIVICILIFGVSFFVIAKYETIEMNKDTDTCVISKTYLLSCKIKRISFNMSDIESVFAYKTGKVSDTTNSVVYKIGIRFKIEDKSTSVYIFKSIFEKFVIEDVKTIKEFLYESVEDYESIKDEIRNGIDYI